MTSSRTLGRFGAVVLFAVSLGACKTPAGARVPDNSKERKERILANMVAKYPSLGDLNPVFGDVEKLGADTDVVTMTIQTPRGENKQTLIVSADNTKLYIAMEGPLDVSRSKEELAAAKSKEKVERAAELAAAVEGLPMRGNPKAKVTIVEFSDFQCPYCSRGANSVEALLEKLSDKVRFVFMHYPLPFHPWAKPASIAAVCAGNQKPDAFWTLHDAYFANQKAITPDSVLKEAAGYLKEAGLDMEQWQACATDSGTEAFKAAAKTVEDAMALGQKHGVEGTPAFFINGEFVNGAVPPAELERLVNEALAEAS